MPSAVIAIEMPPNTRDTSIPQAWNNFIGDVDDLRSDKPLKLDQQKGVSRLGENVWVVNLEENPLAFATLIYQAHLYGLTYKILPLADAPQWPRVG
jgi:hypothetical protein